MAKYETTLHGDFDTLINSIHEDVLSGSASASYEDGCDMTLPNGSRCALRVYERYSMLGGNRVSMSLLYAEAAEGVKLCAVTSGGSQAVMFKMNTIGEENFLEYLTDLLERYQ